jgi:hypothetical protein
MRKGLLDVIQAAYQVDLADEEWLKSVQEAMRPNMDAVEMVSYTYDLAVRPDDLVGALATVNMSTQHDAVDQPGRLGGARVRVPQANLPSTVSTESTAG